MESSRTKCASCGAEQPVDFRYCSQCGIQNITEFKKQLAREKSLNENIKVLAVYTFLSIGILTIGAFFGSSIESLLVSTVVLAIVDFAFAIYQPSVWKLFKVQELRWKPLVAIIVICFCSGLLVPYLINALHLLLYEQELVADSVFEGIDQALLLSIFLVGLAPALFEELAFRGFVFGNLKVIGGRKSAIWGSTFLFALMHFSLISLFWLVPFGYLLAWFRSRYNTLLYGIIGHFVHNTTVTVLDYYGIW